MSYIDSKNCSEHLMTNRMGLDRAPNEFQKLVFFETPYCVVCVRGLAVSMTNTLTRLSIDPSRNASIGPFSIYQIMHFPWTKQYESGVAPTFGSSYLAMNFHQL